MGVGTCTGKCRREYQTTAMQGTDKCLLFLKGWKRCNCCELMIKYDSGRFCPCCGFMLGTKPKSGVARRRFQKRVEAEAKVKRYESSSALQ